MILGMTRGKEHVVRVSADRAVLLTLAFFCLGAAVLPQEPLPVEPAPVEVEPAPETPEDQAAPAKEVPGTEESVAETQEEAPAAEAEKEEEEENPEEVKPEEVKPKPPKPSYEPAIVYYPEYRCQAKLKFWLYPPRASARPNATDTSVSFSPMLDRVSLSLTGHFELETPTKKVYSAEFWSFDEKSNGTLPGDTQWGGGTFSAGEDVTAAVQVHYYNISYGTTLLDKDAFRFGIFLGLDMADVDFALYSRVTPEEGHMNRFIPTLTVGFDMWWYPHEEWGLYGHMTGLSWTDLLGVEAGVFTPSGAYQMIALGAVWRPNANFQAICGYRRFVLRYENTDAAMSIRLNGGFIGATYEW